jgi:hypothetical protein
MKSMNVRLPALGLLMLFLLAACNLPVTPTPVPTPTAIPQPTQPQPTPAGIGAACVVGTWQIDNLSEYLQTALPQMIDGADVQVEETSGKLTYTFNADGTTLGKADNFNIKATVTSNGIKLPGQISVNGSSQGKYQVDDSQGIITLTDVSPGDLAVSATVAGITAVKNTPITNLFLLGSQETGYGSVNYDCVGNTLKVTVNFKNEGPRVVVLQRATD